MEPILWNALSMFSFLALTCMGVASVGLLDWIERRFINVVR
jgi:hypothetical protein